MNILSINTRDIQGGAARAAHRLHLGLHSSGIEASMLVQHKEIDSASIIGPKSQLAKLDRTVRPFLEHLPTHLYSHFVGAPWSTGWVPNLFFNIALAKQKPDIVHLHWVCEGFMPVSALKRLRAPIVWTLHDMWPFTGGCHYAGDCRGYESKCGSCPQLGSNREGDLSRWTWSRKQRHWQNLDLTIVTPSHWLADCARRSTLLGQYRIETIPNGINAALFKPQSSEQCRLFFDLPQNKKIVLFGGVNATDDPRKGFTLLQSSLHRLAATSSCLPVELVLFGDSNSWAADLFEFPCHFVGVIQDDVTLAKLYSAVDVVVVPSLEDNLPNIVMEAIACGTPCASFDVGGISDMIDHKSNGFLAKPYDTDELAIGIEWILGDESRWSMLSKNARIKVEEMFAINNVVVRHIALYREILDSFEPVVKARDGFTLPFGRA